MKFRPDRELLLCFFLATAAGMGLHFLFDLWPSLLTEFISPVNESLWEHVKLIFWPCLLAGAWLTGRGKWRAGPWLGSLLLVCALLLGAGWLLHRTLGTDALALDVSLYLLLMGLVFFLPAVLPVPERWAGTLAAGVIILGGLIVCWTIQPPNAALFHDMTLTDAFLRLPC